MKVTLLIFIFIALYSTQICSQQNTVYDGKCNYWKIENNLSQTNSPAPDLFTWQYIQTSTTAQLTDIFYINEQTGWATHSANGGTWTSNGGINWTSNIFSDTNFTTTYNGVYFVNANTGWEVGGALQIRKTTNGGVSWFKQTPPAAAGVFNNVYFFNENTGIAIGRKTGNYNSFIARTTNSGVNWTEIIGTTSNENELSDQFWFDNNNGWLCGRDVLLKTTNGGLNYTNLYSNIPPTSNGANALLSITFVNQQTGWIGASNLDKKNIYKTTNSGANWLFQDNPVTAYVYVQINDVKFISQDSGWAIHGTPSTGAIMFTTNAGTNWIIEEGSSNWFDCITYFQRVKAWCSASAGKVWYTGPLVFVGTGNNNEIIKDFSLGQNYPNPFNPSTKIRFSIPPSKVEDPGGANADIGKSRGMMDVKIEIYNILGEEVASLTPPWSLSRFQREGGLEGLGTYEVEWNAADYPSGVYFYSLQAGDFSETKKMVLMK